MGSNVRAGTGCTLRRSAAKLVAYACSVVKALDMAVAVPVKGGGTLERCTILKCHVPIQPSATFSSLAGVLHHSILPNVRKTLMHVVCVTNLYRVKYSNMTDEEGPAGISFPPFCTELATPDAIQKERLRGMDL